MKICSQCKEDKDHLDFYFFKDRPKQPCKDCARERQRRYNSSESKTFIPVCDLDSKKCTECKNVKGIDEFYFTKGKGTRGAKHYVSPRCKSCSRGTSKLRSTIRRNNDPVSVRRSYLRMYYNTTPEWYEEQLSRQGGRCALCMSTEPKGKSKWFSVDHDHSCCPGQRTCGNCIRGLLCAPCNTRLGWVENNDEKIQQYRQFVAVGGQSYGILEDEPNRFPTRTIAKDKNNKYNAIREERTQ